MQNFDFFTRITKEEHITTLDHEITPNTFVLEMNKPFPAYYGGQFITTTSKPGNILLVLKTEIDFEDFFRAVESIKKYCSYNFDAALAMVYVHNQSYPAIRLRKLDAFTHIADIQSSFMNEGFEMQKPKNMDTMALIKISKFTRLNENSEGIYRDKTNPHFSYLKVPYKLNWKQFASITDEVRNNIDSKAYDVAKGVFYTKEGMIDFIRVYTENITADELKQIQLKYLAKYARL